MAPPFQVTPLQPTLVREPFHRPGWVWEEKADGWRIVAYRDGGSVRLISRHGVDHTRRFPEVVDAIAKLPASSLILDGELCRFDENLVSRFHLLPDPEPGTVCTPPVYVAFDVLYARGNDLRARPLRDRRAVLEEEVGIRDHVVTARRLAADGLKAWDEVQARGLEGLVAKDEGSSYLAGGPTRRWLKVKMRHLGHFVVGGVTADGERCGGLLLGERVGHVVGFRGVVEFGVLGATLADLLTRAKKLVRPTSPFLMLPRVWEVIWLEPKLEAEVAYSELIQGYLRDPVFVGLVAGPR